ncbi:DMT family transporter [bacterium]|nr:DMT family transporter [bacterium]
MSWVLFITVAAFLWSITNIIDKYLIEKKVKNPLILTIFMRVGTLIPMIIVIPFIGFSIPSLDLSIILLVAGLFAAFGVLLYYKSIQIGEISVIVPLLQLIPIFVLFFSYFLLNEVLHFLDYVGFGIIIVGALVISTKRLLKIFQIEKIFWLILLASVLFAFSDVALKYTFTNTEYWSAFITFWFLQTMILMALLLSGKIREEAKFFIKKLDFRDKMIIIIVAIVSFIAYILGTLAISLGPVTLVGVLANTELVFTFILAALFTYFLPQILKERFDRKTTIQKIIGMIIIISGVLLIQFF